MATDFIKEEQGIQMVEVDLTVYSLDAILKVAYWFTDRCFLHLQSSGPQTVQVRFKPRPGTNCAHIAERFLIELLDQSLRERIARETEAFKNLIVAHALSKTCLIDPERESLEPTDDPLRIGVPDATHTQI